MITEPTEKYFHSLVELIALTIHHSLDTNHLCLNLIINGTIKSSKNWIDNKVEGIQLIYLEGDQVVGVILVKEFWDLSSLFVHPNFQGQGIATNLLSSALEVCSTKSPKSKIVLNSSINASGFYEKFGFKKAGEARDLPGGCIPYEYSF